MLRNFTIFCVVGFFLSLASCANSKGSQKIKNATPLQSQDASQGAAAEPVTGRIWVVKADGSKSCGAQAGMTPEQSMQELKKAGIKVHQHKAGQDGMMHMMVCGADTGNTVEALIDGENLPGASKLGYRRKTKVP
jgi:hypothetical protein